MSSNNGLLACDNRMAFFATAYPNATVFGGAWGLRAPVTLSGATTSYGLWRFPPSQEWFMERLYVRLLSDITGTANANLVLKLRCAGLTLFEWTFAAADWSGNVYSRTTKRSLIGGQVVTPGFRVEIGYGRYNAFVGDDFGDTGGVMNCGTFDSQVMTAELTLGSHASIAASAEFILFGRTVS